MRMGWVWFWFDEQDELRSSRRLNSVSAGKNPLKKYPRPYAARVLLCDRAAAVSPIPALCCHNIELCQRQKARRRRVLLSSGGGYEGGKRSKSRRANERIAIRAAFAAVTEHGARVSRTYKQKTKNQKQNKNHDWKQPKAKSQTSKGKSLKEGQRREEPIYNKHKAYKKKKQGYYIVQGYMDYKAI